MYIVAAVVALSDRNSVDSQPGYSLVRDTPVVRDHHWAFEGAVWPVRSSFAIAESPDSVKIEYDFGGPIVACGPLDHPIVSILDILPHGCHLQTVSTQSLTSVTHIPTRNPNQSGRDSCLCQRRFLPPPSGIDHPEKRDAILQTTTPILVRCSRVWIPWDRAASIPSCVERHCHCRHRDDSCYGFGRLAGWMFPPKRTLVYSIPRKNYYYQPVVPFCSAGECPRSWDWKRGHVEKVGLGQRPLDEVVVGVVMVFGWTVSYRGTRAFRCGGRVSHCNTVPRKVPRFAEKCVRSEVWVAWARKLPAGLLESLVSFGLEISFC